MQEVQKENEATANSNSKNEKYESGPQLMGAAEAAMAAPVFAESVRGNTSWQHTHVNEHEAS